MATAKPKAAVKAKASAKAAAAPKPAKAALPKADKRSLTIKAFVKALHNLSWGDAIDNRTYLRAATHMLFLVLGVVLVLSALALPVSMLDLPNIWYVIPALLGLPVILWFMYNGLKLQVARVHSFGLRAVGYIAFLVALMCVNIVFDLKEETGPSLALSFIKVMMDIAGAAISWYLYFVPGTKQARFPAVKIYANDYISWPVRIVVAIIMGIYLLDILGTLINFLSSI